MSRDPEKSPTSEPRSKAVFDIFDRASSPKRDTAAKYYIGDGIVVRVGWVDNQKPDPDLTLELHDEKQDKGVSLTVGPSLTRYTREARPTLTAYQWMMADAETRRQARQYSQSEPFTIPTDTLEPIADAVSNHDPHTDPEPADSRSLYESSLRVTPLPSTDISYIRELIDAFSQPLR